MGVTVGVRARLLRLRRRFLGGQTAVTDSTPGIASTAFSAALRKGSILASARAVDLDGETDMALTQLQARHHAEADDILAAVGIGHLGQRGQDRFLGDVAQR